ncbi:MAG: hypothetical protein QOI02_19 [Actinomycetota bacterium]|jgi:hypothetical protein|nr:hypothetical protein [Actinomycetota bacterium]
MPSAAAFSAAVAHRRLAGWYPDDTEPTLRRWWNGAEWTSYRSPVIVSQLEIEAEVETPLVPSTTSAVDLLFKPTAPVWIATVLVSANCILFGVLAH